jgi:hypothetical protein
VVREVRAGAERLARALRGRKLSGMNITLPRFTLALGLAVVTGIASALIVPVRAEQPPIDRALVERLVRAEEQQAKQLEALTRAAERCKR